MATITYNNKELKILNEVSFTISSNQVAFGDVTADFTYIDRGKKYIRPIADIPLKYQEVTVETDGISFKAFVDKVSFKNLGTEFVEIKLTLLSPFKMATIRTNTINGVFTTKQAIERILTPLLNDEFTIEAEDFENGQITLDYTIQSIESLMNKVCNKKGLVWWIDKDKKIYIYSIERLLTKSSKMLLNEFSNKEGIISILPQIVNVDYANVINFKNVRLITKGNPLTKSINVKTNDIIQFETPIVIDEDTLRQVKNELPLTYNEDIFALDLDNEYIKLQKSNNQYVKSSGICFNDDETTTAKIVLQRDNFFYNLITGFKWNGANKKLYMPVSDSCLKYTEITFYHASEIDKMQGLISPSGQIEKTIDYASKWTTLGQLNDYAKSLIIQNTNEVSQVEMLVDVDLNLNIGDLINFDLEKYMLKGIYAITEIKYTQNSIKKWSIKLKSSDLLYNYIDLFRKPDNDIVSSNNIIISTYIEDRIDEDIHFDNIEEIEVGDIFGN